MESDLQYMTRALDLAELGRGATRPNPLVGAVLVKNGKKSLGRGTIKRMVAHMQRYMHFIELE